MSVHQHHNFALEVLEPVFAPLNGNGRVLDLGSGYGLQSQWFAQQGFDVVSVDPVAPSVEVPKYVQGDALDALCDFGECSFDFVWTHHVLEHVYDPITALDYVRYLLRPNGWLVCVVPDIDRVISTEHIHNYSIPLLMYHLAATGFDCSRAFWRQRRSHCDMIAPLANDGHGFELSLTRLAELGRFPDAVAQAIRKTGRYDPTHTPDNWFDRSPLLG